MSAAIENTHTDMSSNPSSVCSGPDHQIIVEAEPDESKNVDQATESGTTQANVSENVAQSDEAGVTQAEDINKEPKPALEPVASTPPFIPARAKRTYSESSDKSAKRAKPKSAENPYNMVTIKSEDRYGNQITYELPSSPAGEDVYLVHTNGKNPTNKGRNSFIVGPAKNGASGWVVTTKNICRHGSHCTRRSSCNFYHYGSPGEVYTSLPRATPVIKLGSASEKTIRHSLYRASLTPAPANSRSSSGHSSSRSSPGRDNRPRDDGGRYASRSSSSSRSDDRGHAERHTQGGNRDGSALTDNLLRQMVRREDYRDVTVTTLEKVSRSIAYELDSRKIKEKYARQNADTKRDQDARLKADLDKLRKETSKK